MLIRRWSGRRWRGAAIVAALLATAVPGAAIAEPPLTTLTFVLRRTSPGPTSFQLSASVWNDGRGSFIGHIGAAAKNGRVTAAEALMSGSAGRWKNSTLTAGGKHWSSCDIGVCHDSSIDGYHGLGTTFDDKQGDDPTTHIFVVIVGLRPSYEFTGHGWKLVKLPLSFRYLDGEETSPAFVKAHVAGAELYLDGSLEGGRHGSLAMGVPPCSTAVLGLVPRGVGTVTLDGGVDSESVTCPIDRLLPASYATRGTTWRFHGTVAGDTLSRDTRLFVVDLPARLP